MQEGKYKKLAGQIVLGFSKKFLEDKCQEGDLYWRQY